MTLPPRRVNQGQNYGERAVRAGQFDRAMEEMNAEIGAKMAAALSEYHSRFVEPRLQVVEMVFGISLFRWFRDTILPLYYLPDRYPVVHSTIESEPVQEQVLGDSKIVHIDRRASSMTPGDDASAK